MARALVGVVAVLVLAGLSAPVSAQQPKGKKGKAKEEANPINDAVVAYCKGHVGEKVGNGECWTLAHEAVKAAGAKSSPAYTDGPNKGDYVWGDLTFGLEVRDGKTTVSGAVAKVKSGQVVQYRDTRFAGRRPGGGTYSSSAPHHTAVVTGVSPDGNVITVLHQNFNGKKTVQEATLVLPNLRSGWIKVYQPLAK